MGNPAVILMDHGGRTEVWEVGETLAPGLHSAHRTADGEQHVLGVHDTGVTVLPRGVPLARYEHGGRKFWATAGLEGFRVVRQYTPTGQPE